MLFVICAASSVFAQQAPAVDQNIPYLVTFGSKADITWGDDDFEQTIFFSVPEKCTQPVYIRVYDPNAGGSIDEVRGAFNTKTKFSIYGGKGAHSDSAARKQDPIGNFKSGVLLGSKIFDSDPLYDDKWYTFGPFSPSQGELQKEYGGLIFKVVVEGIDGDDGNLYKLFLSSKKEESVSMEGGNSFYYECSVRLPEDVPSVCHVYPFVSPGAVAVITNVFDYDSEGTIRLVSVATKSESIKPTGDGVWVSSRHTVLPAEINTSLDIQFIKQNPVKRNNIVIYVTNQYGQLMPFYTIPIGGIPKYNMQILVKPTK
jgi:hypothetical protein